MIDLRNPSLPASSVIEVLRLQPHPEGGHYRELFRDLPPQGGRGVATSILFLLAAGERSHWHRIDAVEIWIFQAGAPLLLGIDTGPELRIGPDLAAGEVLQSVVPVGAWQQARSAGGWSLVSCIVAPAFEFAGFELAAAGWAP